jgi:hypothetical protein
VFKVHLVNMFLNGGGGGGGWRDTGTILVAQENWANDFDSVAPVFCARFKGIMQSCFLEIASIVFSK